MALVEAPTNTLAQQASVAANMDTGMSDANACRSQC